MRPLLTAAIALALGALPASAPGQTAANPPKTEFKPVRVQAGGNSPAVARFLNLHNKADATWQTRQCQACHVVPASPPRNADPHAPMAYMPRWQVGTDQSPRSAELLGFYQSLFLAAQQSVVEGIRYASVDETTRAHLKLPQGQGLLILQVDPHAPLHAYGLMLHDIVLKVDEHPVATDQQFEEALKARDRKNVSITLLRQGATRVVRLSPLVKIALNPAIDDTPEYPRYWIGVAVGPIEPALREQLNMNGDPKGLVVINVQHGSPAEKAGLKKGDLLLDLDGKPLTDALALRKLVESIGEKKVELHYGRDGDLNKRLEITPQVYEVKPPRKAENGPARQPLSGFVVGQPLTVNVTRAPEGQNQQFVYSVVPDSPLQEHILTSPISFDLIGTTDLSRISAPGPADLAARVQALDGEIKRLQALVNELSRAATALREAEKAAASAHAAPK